MTSIAVTGASGRLGGRVARRLAGRGAAPRLLVRDPARAPVLPGADVRVAEYADRPAVAAALEGVDVVLLVSAGETPDRVDRHVAFLDGAADAGVGHVVYVSFVGASPNATFTLARHHWATEEHLRSLALDATVLRDNLYADFLPAIVGADGVIRGPAGDGRTAMVAQDDIADAAVGVLLSPERHVGATYELTGPEALTLAEAAEAVSAATGRPVRYEPETVEEAYASRAAYGAPAWQVEAWVSTYLAIAAGELARVTDHVQRLGGHPATPLARVLGA